MDGGTYEVILDEYKSIRTHWTALYMNDNMMTSFDNVSIENILKVIKKFIGNKYITTNILWIPVYDLKICGYFCIRFTDFIFKDKTQIDFTNLFSLSDLKKND